MGRGAGSHLVLAAEAEILGRKVADGACSRPHKDAVLGHALKVAAFSHAAREKKREVVRPALCCYQRWRTLKAVDLPAIVLAVGLVELHADPKAGLEGGLAWGGPVTRGKQGYGVRRGGKAIENTSERRNRPT